MEISIGSTPGDMLDTLGIWTEPLQPPRFKGPRKPLIHDIRQEFTAGLLTRTLYQSPIAKQILPASLWGEQYPGVVFIGEHTVLFKDLVTAADTPGQLRDVLLPCDYSPSGRILSAKVLGLPCNVTLEPPLEGSDGQDETQGSAGWPRHVLVLALSTGSLVFLKGARVPSMRHRLLAVTDKALPDLAPPLAHLGLHMAVDPLCEPDLVVLLVIHVEEDHNVKHCIISWRLSQGLKSLDVTDRVAHNLSDHYVTEEPTPGLPVMLLPMTLPLSYLIVFGSSPMRTCLYKDALSGTAPVISRLSASYSGWVAWARPRRTDKWNMQHDDVYICSDDGQLLLMSMDASGALTITSVDIVGATFDSAFAVLDVPVGQQNGDVLVTAGGFGDGALFTAPARSSVQILQRLPNWAPATACVSIVSERPEVRWDGAGFVSQQGTRLFACAGNGDRQGVLTELQYGVAADISLEISLAGNAPRQIWALPNPAGQGLYLLVAEMLYSTLLYMSAADEEVRAISEDEIAMDLESTTFAAGVTSIGVMVQVTETCINLVVPGASGQSAKHETASPVIAALVDSPMSRVITASAIAPVNDGSQKHTFVVEARPVTLHDGRPGLGDSIGSFELRDEPLSLTIADHSTDDSDIISNLLLIGTLHGKIILRELVASSSLQEADATVPAPYEDISQAVESMVTVRLRGSKTAAVLLCGLRCGWLTPLMWKAKEGGWYLDERLPLFSLGDTPLTCAPIFLRDQNEPACLTPEISATTSIKVDEAKRVALGSLQGAMVFCNAEQLVICKVGGPQQPVPRTIYLPGSPEEMLYSPRLGRLVVASLVSERNVESGHVLTRTCPQVDFINPDTPTAFAFIAKDEANQSSLSEAETGESVPKLRGAAGERVTALLEWTFTMGGTAHTFIVLATQRPFLPDKEDRARGYVHFLRTKFSSRHPTEVESVAKHRLAFEAPVRCCCPFGETGLVLCYGKVARIVRLDPQTRHFVPGPEFALESEAVSVSECRGHVVVMTARNSVLVLAQVSETLGQLALAAQLGCDRAGLSHITLNGWPIFLASHQSGVLVGCYIPAGRRHGDKTMQATFAATTSSAARYLCHARPGLPKDEPQGEVLGMAVDGTVYQLTLLKHEEWALLRFLQELLAAEGARHGHKGDSSGAVGLWSDTITSSDQLHIRGEIVARVCSLGVDYVYRLIERVSEADEAVRKRLEERFRTLAVNVIRDDGHPLGFGRAALAWAQDLVSHR
ncbi:hypothetical protein KEM52_005477 [Ascosphaera acerosa]|nr:hypothetical protein KEM52_005477 [Ascosphaera acerosa]